MLLNTVRKCPHAGAGAWVAAAGPELVHYGYKVTRKLNYHRNAYLIIFRLPGDLIASSCLEKYRVLSLLTLHISNT